ncbi:Nadph dehydrogenase [Mycena venus]|uniref:Nadph dehydrogenase n=1 Tax=Mycena venus TaxID=2733690 RepID=A0A8H7CH59_9AGAR|nr:Nadph dehydrogenase [Mycena venus]
MSADAENTIFSSIVLPSSGRVLHNRLVKVALYEHLAGLLGGPPNKFHLQLYAKWSMYDWGMIFTGNVQVSPQHLSLARDLVLPRDLSEGNLQIFRELAAAMHGRREQKPMAIMQLNHAGRQSPNILGGRLPFASPLGPSSIRVGSSLHNRGILSDLLHRLMFQIPRSMSLLDIDEVVGAFVRGARLAVQTGYDGIELHVAHGYLLAQFISPKSNTRVDEYSCSPSNALRLLHCIVTETRAAVPSNFILGLKINSADYAESCTPGDASASPVLDHILTIASWGSVDFIEISGGDYEKPDFMMNNPGSVSSRQALFADFAHRALHAVASIPGAPLVLLTGGLTTPAQLHAAVSCEHAHLLGIGRAAILRPDLPRLLTQVQPDSDAPFAPAPDLCLGERWMRILQRLPRIKLLGAGAAMAWYIVALRRLAQPEPWVRKPDYSLGSLGGVWWMWAWFEPEIPALRNTLLIVCFLTALTVAVLAS